MYVQTLIQSMLENIYHKLSEQTSKLREAYVIVKVFSLLVSVNLYTIKVGETYLWCIY